MPEDIARSGRIPALGPLYPFFVQAAVLLGLLSLARFVDAMIFREHLDGAAQLGQVMLQGLRIDLVVIAFLLCLPVLIYPVVHTASKKTARALAGLLTGWALVATLAVLFFELITPLYMSEYGVRPERKFFEYLNNPREVLLMLWGTYGFFMVAIPLVLGAGAPLLYRLFARSFASPGAWSVFHLLLVMPLLVVLLAVSMRSSFDHRPVNPSMVAITDDPLINSLPLNSLYSVLYAAYSLKDEANASEIYGELPRDEIFARVAREYRRHNPAIPLRTRSPGSGAPRRNLVIILEESLGARFVAALGGEALTPNLDALEHEGWWFERLYATGTRSVRGLEATVTGFPPTPGRSTVKLPGSQSGFFTLASHLRRQGYRNSFYYGGRAHFDNMKGFFLGNGFHCVIEQEDFVDPKFVGSWGASDEDVLARVHADLLQDPSQPKLIVVLTTSNHTPFDFPTDAGDDFEPPLKSRNNAIRYADKALGEFIRRAKQSAYWDDTVFAVVADHDLRASDLLVRRDANRAGVGVRQFPVAGFHIPGAIVGGGIPKKRISQPASQVDLPPTLLALIGADAAPQLIGTDLTRTDDTYVGRAIMQYNDQQAYLDGDSLVVLRPGKPALTGYYQDYDFIPARDAALADLSRTALAHALWASLMYREGRYH